MLKKAQEVSHIEGLAIAVDKSDVFERCDEVMFSTCDEHAPRLIIRFGPERHCQNNPKLDIEQAGPYFDRSRNDLESCPE